MLTQTWAIFVDAYRELNSKKLFWITMALSGLVVALIACFGITERGVTFLAWQFDSPWFNARIIPPADFYTWAFTSLGVPIWLTWVQTILALISTASIFPDLVAGGSIETVLSKPISRWRLFLTKYAAGLLFVGLQVLVFSLACFVVIGVRGGQWRPSVFLAVPIVVLFFSYLFGVMALLGLLTRSTIASLLLTIMFWVLLWLVNMADGVFIMLREQSALRVERMEARLPRAERAAAEALERMKEEELPLRDEQGRFLGNARDELEVANPMLRGQREALDEARASAASWRTWAWRIVALKTALPKTVDTINLLDRYLLTDEDRQRFRGPAEAEVTIDDPEVRQGDPALAARIEKAYNTRTEFWVVGTSLAFEFVILGIGVWRFSRRDF